VQDSTVTDNHLMNGSTPTPPGPTGGGGLFAMSGTVTVTDSVVSGNSVAGGLSGGGIRSQGNTLSILRSLVSENQASGNGGGVRGIQVNVTDSMIVDNDGGAGGGIYGNNVTVLNSTIARNTAIGTGGGINGSNVTVVNSTVSRNTAGSPQTFFPVAGGGIAGSINSIWFSTITDNHALGTNANGGGIHTTSTVTIRSSIVAGNSAATAGGDISGNSSLFFSLLGTNEGTTPAEAPVGMPDAKGNLIGGPVNGVIDPRLGPLLYNGGFVLVDGSRLLTHALLPGSPAIDAGDSAAAAGVGNVPAFDERGTPFARVADGDGAGGARLDMGALESQPNPLPGDYNFDGIVDAVDYTVWRNTVGSADDFRADGSGPTVGVPDGVVDAHDYAFWKANYGNTLPMLGSGGLAAAADVVEEPVVEAVAIATDVATFEGEKAAPGYVFDDGEHAPASGSLRSVASRRLSADESDAGLLARWLASRARDADGDRESESPWRDRRGTEDADCLAALDDAFELLEL
jgi:hypothetical protein